MKVGIIGTRGIPNNYGGFERFVELLVRDPIWEGQVEFFIYGEKNSCNHSQESAYTYVPLNLVKSRGVAYYVESVWKASLNCDVILCCGVGLSIAAFLPKFLGRKLVINPDGCEWRRTKWSSIGRLCIKAMYFPALLSADRIVIDAEGLRDDFGARFSPKSVYIPYQAQTPLDCDLCRPQNFLEQVGIEEKQEYVLVIARLEPENNIKVICDAFLKSGRGDLKLLVVGNLNTRYFEKELNHISAQNPDIIFSDGVYNQSILNGLRSSAIAYVHGHTVGGTNPSLIEALATRPGIIICHDNKYNHEVACRHAEYFSSVKQLSYLFARLPSQLLNEKPTWSDQRFNPKTIALQYLRLFESITKQGK